jgi:hypothetical protein
MSGLTKRRSKKEMKRRRITLQVELEIDEYSYKTWLGPEEVGSALEDLVEGSGLMSEVVCKDLGWVEEDE